jgi:hypothetical protein
MNDFNKTEESSPYMNWHQSRIVETCFFLLIILLEAGIFIYLIHERSIVGGNDGFQYFYLQYYFFNHVVNYGDIPLWIPFMTHGTIATWWYIIQAGIFQNVLLLTGDLFKNVNFLPLFYTGIFIDELLLLTGVWLLGRRFFASPLTTFFVSLSVMGSCIWMLQPWWNFHLYYAIPLILYFIHTFVDTGKWRYFFLAGNLLFIQCLGNLPYYLSFTSLVIFLYFFFYFLFNYQDTLKRIKSIQFGIPFVTFTLLIIFLFVALYIAVSFGTDQIVNSTSRNPDGSLILDVFLTYGGEFNWWSWLEIFSRLSPCLDYTLYMGIICVPFVLLGLIFNLNRQNIHFLLTIIILFLFSMGTFVSVFFYYSWPMMKYFRHLMLVSPMIKIFLCFLAGFGFDALFFNRSRWKENPTLLNSVLIFISILMIGLSSLLWILSNHHEMCVHLLHKMALTTSLKILFDENIITILVRRTALLILAISILFVTLALIDRKKNFLPLVIFLLLLHCADLYGYKFSEIGYNTVPLNDKLYKMIEFQPMPYEKRRDVSFWENNPRAEILKALSIREEGSTYWSADSFLFKDELYNPFRTDHWLKPLNDYLSAHWKQFYYYDMGNKNVNRYMEIQASRHFFDGYRLNFPQMHPATLKISGVTEDKIQFFELADIISPDDNIASKITNAEYKGDIIFLSPLEKNKNMSPVNSSFSTKNYLSLNKRLHLPYQVPQFDSNNIEIVADANKIEPAWLLYSDVWHPFWRATINGKETPVYKTNLAYKAVKLEPGLNKVHFYFKSKLMSTLYFIFGLNALCWLIIILYLTGKTAFNHRAAGTNNQKPG